MPYSGSSFVGKSWDSENRFLLQIASIEAFDFDMVFSLLRGLGYIYLIQKTMEFRICQKLSQPIGKCLVSDNIYKLDSTNGHFVSDVIVFDVNVFCLWLENEVVTKSNRVLVVSFQKNCVFDEV